MPRQVCCMSVFICISIASTNWLAFSSSTLHHLHHRSEQWSVEEELEMSAIGLSNGSFSPLNCSTRRDVARKCTVKVSTAPKTLQRRRQQLDRHKEERESCMQSECSSLPSPYEPVELWVGCSTTVQNTLPKIAKGKCAEVIERREAALCTTASSHVSVCCSSFPHLTNLRSTSFHVSRCLSNHHFSASSIDELTDSIDFWIADLEQLQKAGN